MIQKITEQNKLIALLIDNTDIEEGTHPITDPRLALQMLMMKRSKGHVFDKHTHEIFDRTTNELQEAVVVTKGKLRITVCLRDGTDVGSYNVSGGQCLYVVEGGFKIEVLEDSLFYEFKNGPYKEDKILL